MDIIFCVNHQHISIHALLTEGDVSPYFPSLRSPVFQSTPSSRRATPVLSTNEEVPPDISIHALLTEGDRKF